MPGDPGWKRTLWHLYQVSPVWSLVFEETAWVEGCLTLHMHFPLTSQFSEQLFFLSKLHPEARTSLVQISRITFVQGQERIDTRSAAFGGQLGRQFFLIQTFHQSSYFSSTSCTPAVCTHLPSSMAGIGFVSAPTSMSSCSLKAFRFQLSAL